MLSVLIPVYNFDIYQLVSDLHSQSMVLDIPVEIIVAEDASEEQYMKNNKQVDLFHNVTYIQLKENLGRSRIRNFLSSVAKYPFLVFMDCDSKTENSNFLKNYAQFCSLQSIVICGGRTYEKEKPLNQGFYLRWLYGVKREVISVEQRLKNPYKSFMTNNFAISKSILNTIGFDEKFKGYGHEDTLFGLELERLQIHLIHIDNPLIHIGLEDSFEFIYKTEQGLVNLIHLIDRYSNPEKVFEKIKIANYFNKIHRIGLVPFIGFIFRVFQKVLIWNLTGKNPNLLCFDCYKIGFLCNYYKNRK